MSPPIRGVRLGFCFTRGRPRPLRLLISITLCLMCYFLLYNQMSATTDDIQNKVILEDEDAEEATHNDKVTQYHKKCSERHNVVYLKMIKCASETLSSVIRRFGYERNLSFVLPLDKKIYLGWPYQMQANHYRPSKTGEYNLVCHHVVFNETAFKQLMPSNTVFITSIREPYSQFVSMFHYYKLAKLANVTGAQDPVTEYLNNLDKYEAIYKSPGAAMERYCIPDGFSMSKNLMSFNLGFQTGFPPGKADLSRNRVEISRWLHSLEKKFSLIMLVEYLDESLVLLKRLLCWSLQDVLYHTRNVGVYHHSRNVSSHNQAIYKEWSNVDYELYNHFKKIFWKQIGRQGPDFKEEVDHFRVLRQRVDSFCTDPDLGKQDKFSILESKWNSDFVVNKKFCDIYTSSGDDQIISQYENIKVKVSSKEKTSINFC